MKLTGLFLILASICVSANNMAQHVTINIKNNSLKVILTELRKQTGKDFLYNTNLINDKQKIDFAVRNQDLTQALDLLTEKINLQYKVNGNTVLIQPNTNSENNSSKIVSQQVIKGTVKNENQQAIAGATISLVNTTKQTATDAFGEFSFTNVPSSGEINISMIGYEPKTIKYTNGLIPEIVLKNNMQEMEELVIVGYGKQTKKRTNWLCFTNKW